MALSTDERQLIAEALRYARSQGWARMKPAGRWRKNSLRFDYRLPIDGRDTAWLKVYWTGSNKTKPPHGNAIVSSVAQAVDVLVAVGVLPAELSSAYREGVADELENYRDLSIEQLMEIEVDKVWEHLESNDVLHLVGEQVAEVAQLIVDGDPWARREAAKRIVETFCQQFDRQPKAVAP